MSDADSQVEGTGDGTGRSPADGQPGEDTGNVAERSENAAGAEEDGTSRDQAAQNSEDDPPA